MSLTTARLVSIAAALACSALTAQAQTVVSFEDLAGNNFLQNNSVVSNGFKVTHSGSFAQVLGTSGQGGTDFSGNGSKRLISFNTSAIDFSAVNGSAFDLAGFDGGESWISSGSHGWATQIQAIGYFAAGGSTTQIFNLDLVKTATTGLQHFDFNGSFQNLQHVTFSGIGGNPEFSLDNVAVTAPVPEPETYALLLAGLGAVGFVARRRGRRA